MDEIIHQIMWPLYAIIGVLLLVFILLDYVQNKDLYNKAARIDGPKAYPIVGNIFMFLNLKTFRNFKTEVILETIMKFCDSYPSPYRLWVGNRICIQIYDPDQMKAVFMSPKTLGKADYYKFAEPWLGKGLVVAPLSEWKTNRKIIQPTFNTKVLQSFFEIFKRHSSLVVQELMTKYQGKEFDMLECMSACTLNIICESAMGVSVTWTKDRHNRFAKAAQRAMEIMMTRVFKIWLHPNFLFKFTQMSRDFDESVEYMHNITEEVIQRKKKEFKSNKAETENTGNQRKAFLDLLMELKDEKLSEKQLRDEVTVMIIGGNDTTASALSFCTLMLASHPDIQDKVYQELYEIYGDDNSENNPVKPEDLPRMIYLERVIKESLRLFPAAPFILRQVTEDLEIGKYIFPKGAIINLVISKLHRDEKIWPNPTKFDPDRFLPEEVAKRHPYAYVPFAAGPRNCIGQAYAMMSMKVLLATVLRKCVIKKDKIVPVQDIKLSLDVLSKPIDPIMLRFEERIKN